MGSLENDVIDENLNEKDLSNQKVNLIVNENQSKSPEVNMVGYMHLFSQYNTCHSWVQQSTETSLAIITELIYNTEYFLQHP